MLFYLSLLTKLHEIKQENQKEERTLYFKSLQLRGRM